MGRRRAARGLASADGNTWGSACFKQWGVAEATVACRQLGLGVLGLPRSPLFPGFAASVPAPSASQLNTLLNIQNCGGDEDDLTECSRLPWGKQSCNNNAGVAGVVCIARIKTTSTTQGAVRLAGGDINSGRVEVLLGDGVYGSICAGDDPTDYKWKNAGARVVCKQLGFAGGTARTVAPDANTTTVLNNVDCAGDEESVLGCDRDSWGDVGNCKGNSGYVAAVVCSGVPTRR
ncbi:hypothetical protein GPECTOR_31g333 [Gonium pectorale]|uniref:SRCR domain-containing protein n=1 Tax=Gonium pectorale TaxID=33097 RepID=A0A150GDP1_GONPE|nr:hypothetical protein GPECTOR_31g333 [Gonium pectorale]|eukprot:KXZ47971.1 hypothetical protein GPECTOR_31g333 [Gonium pectorale]